MIEKKYCEKTYASAKNRFLKEILVSFFKREFPQLFGPVIRNKIADELLSLFEKFSPETQYLKPGQVFWVAIDKETRPDSPVRKFKPVVLSLVTEEDIRQLESGIRKSVITKQAVARMIRETYQQGAVLSNRDLSLLALKTPAQLSRLRRDYEKEHDVVLPHSGVIFDMGTTLTHKDAIVRKVVIEKKDPSVAAREINHSQKSADRYLNDYSRVATVYEYNKDPLYIHHVTGIANHVVKQYIEIIKNETSQPNT
jgi:hypothetical protein